MIHTNSQRRNKLLKAEGNELGFVKLQLLYCEVDPQSLSPAELPLGLVSELQDKNQR